MVGQCDERVLAFKLCQILVNLLPCQGEGGPIRWHYNHWLFNGCLGVSGGLIVKETGFVVVTLFRLNSWRGFIESPNRVIKIVNALIKGSFRECSCLLPSFLRKYRHVIGREKAGISERQ